jgi:hypothetical protein
VVDQGATAIAQALVERTALTGRLIKTIGITIEKRYDLRLEGGVGLWTLESCLACPRHRQSHPWHTDWFSSAKLGFHLVVDHFHREVHPLIRQYVWVQIRTGDQALGPPLQFRGCSGNDHCEFCDQGPPSMVCQDGLLADADVW